MGERGTRRGPGHQLATPFVVRLAAALRQAADSILAVVLAPSCAACGTLLDRPLAGAICDRCWRSILPLTPPLCDACGDPLPSGHPTAGGPARCPRCRDVHAEIDRARAVGSYDGALRAIVHALKYDGRRSVARPLGALMRARGAEVLSGADWVVPVPLHPSRLRTRGFNQAADLARHLGAPVCQPLRRRRATRTQAELTASERRRNVRDAFSLRRRRVAGLEGSIVVLIDDVSTTGATLAACASVLKAAGVREVRALTAARVAQSPR
jgi:ComF family protein